MFQICQVHFSRGLVGFDKTETVWKYVQTSRQIQISFWNTYRVVVKSIGALETEKPKRKMATSSPLSFLRFF